MCGRNPVGQLVQSTLSLGSLVLPRATAFLPSLSFSYPLSFSCASPHWPQVYFLAFCLPSFAQASSAHSLSSLLVDVTPMLSCLVFRYYSDWAERGEGTELGPGPSPRNTLNMRGKAGQCGGRGITMDHFVSFTLRELGHMPGVRLSSVAEVCTPHLPWGAAPNSW